MLDRFFDPRQRNSIEKIDGFPKRVRLGPNSVAWKGEEIKRWIDGLAHEDVE